MNISECIFEFECIFSLTAESIYKKLKNNKNANNTSNIITMISRTRIMEKGNILGDTTSFKRL